MAQMAADPPPATFPRQPFSTEETKVAKSFVPFP